MAQKQITFFRLLIIVSLLAFSVFCKSSSSVESFPSYKSSKTCMLNVTESLHRVVHVSSMTYHYQAEDQHDSLTSTLKKPNGYLRLKLHSRDSLYNSGDKDYRSRVLTRLARDSERVGSLQTLLPRPSFDSPVVSGTSQGSGEYFSRVGIGDPPHQLYVVIDTGSDISWVQCEPCSRCYSQSDPIYDPSKSSSFVALACDTPMCRTLDVSECRNRHCLYEVSYGDESYTAGDFVTETITFSGETPTEAVALGCGHTNEGLFVGAGGLLGLGGGALSFPSQINATSFSYCLVDRDSRSASTLEFNSERVDSLSHNSVSSPLIKNPLLDTFYYVSMTGITVGGTRLSVPKSAFTIDRYGNGGVIIDSGTAITRLEESVYISLRDEFRREAENLPTAEGVAIFDTCYDLRGRSTVAVPAVELEFVGGKRLALPAKNYMILVDAQGTFCLAFAGTASSMSIIGNVLQQGTRVRFDMVEKVVSFHPDQC